MQLRIEMLLIWDGGAMNEVVFQIKREYDDVEVYFIVNVLIFLAEYDDDIFITQ